MMQISLIRLTVDVFQEVVGVSLYLHGFRKEGIDEVQTSLLEPSFVTSVDLLEFFFVFVDCLDGFGVVVISIIVKT